MFAARTHRSGALAWSLGVGGVGYDWPTGAVTGSGGTTYVTGQTGSSTDDLGDRARVSAGVQDVAIIAIDRDGAFQWAQLLGGAGYDQASTPAVDGAGNLVLAGSFSETVDFGDGPRTSVGARDVFVGSWTPGGQLRWVRTFGGPGDEGSPVVVIDEEGYLTVCGTLTGTGDFGSGVRTANGEDLFIAAFGPSGEPRWERLIGGPDDERCWGLARVGRDLYVAGTQEGSLDLGQGAVSAPDGTHLSFLMRLVD